MVLGAATSDGFEISLIPPQANSPLATIVSHCTLAMMAALVCLTVL